MAKIKCPECGNMIDEKAIECPVCGTKIAENIVRCDHCGEVFFKDDGLCPNCHRPPKKTGKNKTNQQTAQENPKKEIQTPSTKTQDLTASVAVVSKDEPEGPNPEQPEEEQPNEMVADASQGDTPTQAEEEATDTDNSSNEDEDNESKPVKQPFKLKVVPMLVSVAIAAIIGLVSIYFYRDSKIAKEVLAYQLAIGSTDTLELQHFLSQYADASLERKDSIKMRLQYLQEENRSWGQVLAEKTKEHVGNYIQSFPDGAHFNEAQTVMDSIDWAAAASANTALAYHEYLKEHADGVHATEAKTRIYGSHMDVVEPEEKGLVIQSLNAFFTAVNKHDKEQFRQSLHSRIVSFMGTESPTAGEAVAWLDRQYADGVQSINWTLNDQSTITKKKSDIAAYEYKVEIGGMMDMVKNGNATQDRYKITARMTPDGKISSVAMVKHVPQEGEAAKSNSSSADKPKPSSSSTTSSGSSNSKPSNSTGSKPATNTKPSSGSKPSSSNTKPSSQPKKSNTSGTKTNTSSKPSSSNKNNSNSNKSNTKPDTKTNSSSASKPANNKSNTSKQTSSKSNTSNKSNTTKQNKTSTPAKSSSTSNTSKKATTSGKTNNSSSKKSNSTSNSSNKSSSKTTTTKSSNTQNKK